MWTLYNTTPYPAASTWMRDVAGGHLYILAVKATFDIDAEGKLKLADEQLPPTVAPKFHDDPGTSSLKYESDLAAVKPGTDVVLHAYAHAPGGRPASSVEVLLRMGNVSKHLVVYGERVYYDGFDKLATSSPQPFTSCPIRYELAVGGTDLTDPDLSRQAMDRRNPVGRGVVGKSKSLTHRPAHRIEYAQGDAARRAPAGFGPIASHWSPRVELAGTYGAAWERTKKPLLPDDYDPRHELCSPEDQRPEGWLYGGELVELLNMTAEGSLRFQLPRLYFTYASRFGRREQEHRGHMSSVIIEPEQRRVMTVYQTSLSVKRKDVMHLDETIIRLKEHVR